MTDHVRCFFNGCATKLRGAFEQTNASANANRGIARERAISLLLEDILPASCTATHGEIVDGSSHASGQLDAIIMHHSGLALSTGGTGPRIVLVEGVMAALEVKSNLSTQWSEVMGTATKLLAVRRSREMDGPFGKLRRTSSSGDGPCIPFCVVGYQGWKTPEKLTEHGNELAALVSVEDWPWGTFVVQLDPPGLFFARLRPGSKPLVETIPCGDENRGIPLYTLWIFLASMAQYHVPRHADWRQYRYVPAAVTSQPSERPIEEEPKDQESHPSAPKDEP